MTSEPSIEQLEVRLDRVTQHLDAGDELFQRGNEWSTVAYFYAAYHQMKVAMLEDPVFDDPDTLTSIHMALRQTDRDAAHHQGSPNKPGGRSMGVTDIAIWVYRPYAANYRRLHSASVDVRYHCGVSQISAETAKQDAYRILQAYKDGKLRYGS